MLNDQLTRAENGRLAKRSLYFLYHELRPAASTYSYVLETAKFESHVNLFLELRDPATTCFWPEITFDDGHMSNFECALPVLKERNIAAEFFITVGWTGTRPGYMGWEELRHLQASGQRIGAHGWTHKLLTHCHGNELALELEGARLKLEDKLGTPIVSMSFPGGRFDQRILSACRRAGYEKVYTSIPRPNQIPSEAMVGRLNILGNVQLEWLAKVLRPETGVLSSQIRDYERKVKIKALLGDRLYEKVWAIVNRKEHDQHPEAKRE